MVVRLPSGVEVAFLGTHLDHLRADDNRRMQAKALATLGDGLRDRPAVLAGDLNMEPGSGPWRSLLDAWTPATEQPLLATYPAVNPVKAIDHVLYRPAAAMRVIEATVVDAKAASDHRPLLVVLELR